MLTNWSSSGDLVRKKLHLSVQAPPLSYPSKLQVPKSPLIFLKYPISIKTRVFLGFKLRHNTTRPKTLFSLPKISSFFAPKTLLDKTHILIYQKQNPRGFSPGFKLSYQAETVAYPTRAGKNSKKKEGGGPLSPILRALETEDEIDKVMSVWVGKLSPRDQTVLLKEQGGWARVLRLFKWMKSQEEYIPNVIHYNVVLRVLGRSQKWDELRLCWIEMAKDGVFPSDNTYGMLVDVYGKGGLVKEALLWIRHMRQRNLYPNEVTMNTVVRVLKDIGEFDMADRFYKDWCAGRVEINEADLESISRLDPISPKHFLSTELFKSGGRMPPSKEHQKISARKPQMTATYNTLIDLYGKAGRLKDASHTFEEMMKSGVAPDTITFNTMIFTCGTHGLLSEAEALLSKMEEKRISPDTRTYNIFLSLYDNAGNIDAALTCYKKIREVGLFPNMVTHRAVLQVFCERNMVSEVESVIEEMEKAGRCIDEHSVPVIIKMYVGMGLLDRAKVIFEKCQLEGQISSKTYAAVIDVYAEKSLWVEAEEVFFGKRDLVTQKKDVVEYNVMIKAYGKSKLYDRALSLFNSMRSSGMWPDKYTYNSIVQMLSGGDLIDSARDMLVEMQEAGFKPLCATFSTVIASCVRAGRLSDAEDVYGEMMRAGVKPNEVVYGSLIDGFAEASRLQEALHYFNAMEESGISGNQIVITSLIKAYSKVGCLTEAQTLFMKMGTMEGGPDTIACNSMISLYADLGLISEANLILNWLRETGRADGVSFAIFVCMYRNMGMLDRAIDAAQEMQESGLLKDIGSFNAVLALYAADGQLRECGELLHQMITDKVSPDGGTFKIMFTMLKKGGLPTEALMQLESSYRERKPYARQVLMTSVFSVVGLHAFALESFNAFKKDIAGLDSYAYNVAINVYGSSGMVNEALNMFMKMKDEGLEPDIVTYISLVVCYGKARMVEAVRRIYSQLEDGEIEPNESLFKGIIDVFLDAGRRDLADMARQEMRFALENSERSDSETEEDPLHFNGESSEDPLQFNEEWKKRSHALK